MQRLEFSQEGATAQLEQIASLLQGARHFERVDGSVLRSSLRQGALLTLDADEVLIREGDASACEMYVLVDGSLAVESRGQFILRLERAGDILGELSLLEPTPRSADVVAERRSRVVAFPPQLLQVPQGAASAPVFYAMLAHILAAKLKLTTAQSLLRKNERAAGGARPRVAVVDSCDADRAAICAVVAAEWPQAEVVAFADPQCFAQDRAGAPFALVVADVARGPPGVARHEAIRLLLDEQTLRGSPLCVVSDHCRDPARCSELLELGAADCLPKPLATVQLSHAVQRSRQWYYKDRELDRAEREADTDALTGLANRRRLDEFLDALHTTYDQYRQPFALILADVDHFKQYNDRHGHALGDAVLAQVGALLRSRARRGDLAARYGGEEFVVVLQNCALPAAAAIAEDLREAIARLPIAGAGQQPLQCLSATFGVAAYPGPADVAALLAQADRCLYHGKACGRNVVVVADGAGPPSPAASTTSNEDAGRSR